MKKVLVVSIGNSTTRLGVYAQGRIVRSMAYATQRALPPTGLRRLLKGMRIDACVACSVVPRRTRVVCRSVEKIARVPVQLVGTHLRVALASRYRAGLGQDRLVGAWQAMRHYGAPVIVVDCGTAITVNAVSRNNVFSGGMIFPGMALCARALKQGTAQLPWARHAAPRTLLGTDTLSGIQSGVALGCAGAVQEMIARIRRTAAFSGAKVVATGGGARFLKRYCRSIDLVDEELVLKGLGACGTS